MVKNKKVIKRETESDTDTDTENDKKVINSKVDKAKKTKIYMILALVLLSIAAFMWYRKRATTQLLDNGQVAQTQVVQQRPIMSGMQQMSQMPSSMSQMPSSMSQMPSSMPPMQMGGMQQRLNPIQEIQLTQQMH
jgi:hypothetical protein